MVSLLSRDDRGVGNKREVNTGVWHQVGLELGQIHVESTIEAEGGSNGGHNLTNETVQVGVGGALNVQVPAANVVDGFIVNHECAVGVFQSSVSSQDGVVGFNNGSRDLGGWVDGKFKLGLLAVVNRETFHQEGGETRSSATTKGVEDEEALKSSALISKFTNAVEYQVNNFLSNGVVTTGIVVSSILLAGDKLLGVEQLAVSTSADLICNKEDSITEMNKK